MKSAYTKYVLSLLLFGSNGIVASYIFLASHEIVLFRTFIGTLFLMLIFLLTKKESQALRFKKDFIFLLFSGAAMGTSWMFLYEAYRQVGVSIATMIYYCGPVIVMAVSPILFQERMTRLKALGFLIVLVGMLLLNGKLLTQGGNTYGLFCGIMSACMYAAMVVFNKKAARISGLENSVYQLAASFVIVALFTFRKQGIAIMVPAASIAPILFLGIVNTGLGCYLYFSSIQTLPAGSVAICGYLEPLSTLLFTTFLLQEQLGTLQWVGAFFILGGAAVGTQS